MTQPIDRAQLCAELEGLRAQRQALLAHRGRAQNEIRELSAGFTKPNTDFDELTRDLNLATARAQILSQQLAALDCQIDELRGQLKTDEQRQAEAEAAALKLENERQLAELTDRIDAKGFEIQQAAEHLWQLLADFSALGQAVQAPAAALGKRSPLDKTILSHGTIALPSLKNRAGGWIFEAQKRQILGSISQPDLNQVSRI